MCGHVITACIQITLTILNIKSESASEHIGLAAEAAHNQRIGARTSRPFCDEKNLASTRREMQKCECNYLPYEDEINIQSICGGFITQIHILHSEK